MSLGVFFMEKQIVKSDLTEGWEILLSAYLYRDTVKGKTRLNKTLSEFQREGLPIEEKFIISEHGPYSKEVHEKATKLYEGRLLDIEKKKLGSDKQRFDYSITPEGKSIVEKEITKSSGKSPFPDEMLKNAVEIVRKFKQMDTKEIVKTVHEDLFIDNDELFYEELEDTENKAEELLETLDEEYEKLYFCDGLIQAIGNIEFCKNSIEEVLSNFEIIDKETFIPPEEAGNHHILSIAKESISQVEKELMNHLKNHPSSRAKTCEDFSHTFKLLTAKAELNSAVVYDIYSPTVEV